MKSYSFGLCLSISVLLAAPTFAEEEPRAEAEISTPYGKVIVSVEPPEKLAEAVEKPEPVSKKFKLNICNKNDRKLTLAVAYETAELTDHWRLKGWYVLETNKCKTFTDKMGGRDNLPFFFYAEEIGGPGVWSGNSRSFTLPNEAFNDVWKEHQGLPIRGTEYSFHKIVLNAGTEHTQNLAGN